NPFLQCRTILQWIFLYDEILFYLFLLFYEESALQCHQLRNNNTLQLYLLKNHSRNLGLICMNSIEQTENYAKFLRLKVRLNFYCVDEPQHHPIKFYNSNVQFEIYPSPKYPSFGCSPIGI